MSSAYCHPDWHEGRRVEADYMLAALEAVPDPDRMLWQRTSGLQPLARFAVCHTHVESALHVMLRQWKSVRVVETPRAAQLDLGFPNEKVVE